MLSLKRGSPVISWFALVSMAIFIYGFRATEGSGLTLTVGTLAVVAFWYLQSIRISLSNARTLILLLLGLGFAVFLFQDQIPFFSDQNMTGIQKAFDIKPGSIASLKNSHETALSLYYDHEPTPDERYFKTGVLNATSDGLEYHLGPRATLATGSFPETTAYAKNLPDQDLEADLLAIQNVWTSQFNYSLNPGLMEGAHRLDTFLFEKKIGFCEHYAAALTTLLKLKHQEARVAVGLAGGSWNPLFRKLTYLMSDSHAWVEVYEPSTHHWRKLDPTLWINPEENAPRSARALINWTTGILSAGLFLTWILSGRIKDPLKALLKELSRFETKHSLKAETFTVTDRLKRMSEFYPLRKVWFEEFITAYQNRYFTEQNTISDSFLLGQVRRLRWFNFRSPSA